MPSPPAIFLPPGLGPAAGPTYFASNRTPKVVNAIQLIQSASSAEGSVNFVTVTLPKATHKGSTLVVCVTMYGESGGTSIDIDTAVTDAGTNQFKRIPGATMVQPGNSWGQRTQWYVATNITNKASEIVRADFNQPSFAWIGVWEVTPAVFDQVVVATNRTGGSGVKSITPGTITPSAPGAYLFATVQFDPNATTFSVGDGNWTMLNNQTAGGGSMYTASAPMLIPRATTFPFVGTSSGSPTIWGSVGLSFIPAIPGQQQSYPVVPHYPKYLPRSLGPRAVGPTFFAPNAQQQIAVMPPGQVLSATASDSSSSSDSASGGMVIARQAGVVNEVTDPSFEYDTPGSPPPSSRWASSTTAGMVLNTFLVSNAWAASGAQSLHVQATHDGTTTSEQCGPETANTDRYPVVGNESYWMQGVFNIIQAATTGIQLKVGWYDNTGTQLSTSSSGNSHGGATGLFQLGFTASAPPTAVSCRLFGLAVSNVPGEVFEYYIDSLLITPGTAAVTYNDGDSSGSEWTGTPGASASFTPYDLSLSSDNASGTVASGSHSFSQTGADTSVTSDSASENSVLSRTSSETSNSSDTATGANVRTRTGADTSASSDTASGANVRHRTGADTSVSSDTATGANVRVRTSADTSASSDTAVGANGKARTGADTSNSSDTATGANVRTRTSTDTSTTSDTATRVDPKSRTTADTSNSSDSASRAADAFVRTATDTSASSDVGTRLLRDTRTASDTSSTSDVALEQLGKARTGTDTSVTSDAAVRNAQALVRTTADTSTSSDSGTGGKFITDTAADTSNTSDTATQTAARHRTGADTSNSSDTASRAALLFTRTTADTSATSDAGTRGMVFARTSNDTSVLSDSATRTDPKSRTASDTSTSSDTTAESVFRTGSDTSTSSDSVTVKKIYGQATADTSTTSDSGTRLVVSSRTSSETSHSTDAAVGSLTKIRTGTDTSLSSDAATRNSQGLLRTSSDTSTTTDSGTRLRTQFRTGTDTSASSDTASRALLVHGVASDTTLTTDGTSGGGSHSVTGADTSHTTDSDVRSVMRFKIGLDTSLTSDSTSRGFLGAHSASDTTHTEDVAKFTLLGPASAGTGAITVKLAYQATIGVIQAANASLTIQEAATVTLSVSIPSTTLMVEETS